MARVGAAVVAATAVGALLTAGEAHNGQLPGCSFAQGPAIRGAAVKPSVRLRVATVPEQPNSDDEPVWVLTVINLTNRPRSLAFADSAFAEVELWRNRRRVYSWYERHAHLQAFWGRVLPARSSWTCLQGDFDLEELRLTPGRYTLVSHLRNYAGPVPWYSREIVVE